MNDTSVHWLREKRTLVSTGRENGRTLVSTGRERERERERERREGH